MVTYENECCCCPKEMGCLGERCPNQNVEHLICDDCGKDVDELYEYDGEQLCLDCLLNAVGARKVET